MKAYKVDVTKAVRVAPKELTVVDVVLFDQESVWCSLSDLRVCQGTNLFSSIDLVLVMVVEYDVQCLSSYGQLAPVVGR